MFYSTKYKLKKNTRSLEIIRDQALSQQSAVFGAKPYDWTFFMYSHLPKKVNKKK